MRDDVLLLSWIDQLGKEPSAPLPLARSAISVPTGPASSVIVMIKLGSVEEKPRAGALGDEARLCQSSRTVSLNIGLGR